jgi:hypothetical protein
MAGHSGGIQEIRKIEEDLTPLDSSDDDPVHPTGSIDSGLSWRAGKISKTG